MNPLEVPLEISKGDDREWRFMYLDGPVEDAAEFIRIDVNFGTHGPVDGLRVKLKPGAQYRISCGDATRLRWDTEDVITWVRGRHNGVRARVHRVVGKPRRPALRRVDSRRAYLGSVGLGARSVHWLRAFDDADPWLWNRPVHGLHRDRFERPCVTTA